MSSINNAIADAIQMLSQVQVPRPTDSMTDQKFEQNHRRIIVKFFSVPGYGCEITYKARYGFTVKQTSAHSVHGCTLAEAFETTSAALLVKLPLALNSL